MPDVDLGPDHEAALQVSRALGLAADDRLDDAAQTLASVVASLAPVRDGGRWFDGPDAALTPLAEAHVRLAQALVHLWRGTLTRAADELAEAAFRLPLGLPFAGMGVAAARRLDMMTRGRRARRDGARGRRARARRRGPCASACSWTARWAPRSPTT